MCLHVFMCLQDFQNTTFIFSSDYGTVSVCPCSEITRNHFRVARWHKSTKKLFFILSTQEQKNLEQLSYSIRPATEAEERHHRTTNMKLSFSPVRLVSYLVLKRWKTERLCPITTFFPFLSFPRSCFIIGFYFFLLFEHPLLLFFSRRILRSWHSWRLARRP